MIDFRDIRSGVDGQRGAFENLVCQLGHRSPPMGAVEFRRIEGAGGDGGIEAYWVLADGSEYGYQAKFHTRSADVDWAALDASVATALAVHPALTVIEVALACDLTGPVAGRGRSGLDQWEVHSSRWRASAANLGREVRFILCDATMLEGRLAAPVAAGLVDYWFGALSLSSSWLANQFNRTVTMLEERFQPDDHVPVDVRSVFDGLCAREVLGGELREILSRACADLPRMLNYQLSPEIVVTLDGVVAAVASLRSHEGDLEVGPAHGPAVDAWRERLHVGHMAIEAAFDALDAGTASWAPGRGSSSSVSADRSLGAQLAVLQSRLGELRDAFDTPALRSLDTRFAILTGRAGSGKSHLLASEVASLLDYGTPTLMLLGTDFTGTEPIGAQMLRRLDLTAGLDVFLGALDAAAETRGTRALLVIDAVNEGAGASLWRERLAAFADSVLAYPRLALCVSCRSEYAVFLLTQATRDRAVSINVPGFVTLAEQEAAAVVYLDHRGIVRPATPWLSPEFGNPLFLRTTCNALCADGRTEFPRGLRGTREMLSLYLSATARHLGTSYDGSNDLVAPLRAAVLALARRMASDTRDFLERGIAAAIVTEAFAGYASPPGSTWLELLRLRGILRIDPHPDLDPNDPLAVEADVFRFGFQRFQDHLIAETLLGTNGPVGTFEPGGRLAFLLGPDQVHWSWLGVFQALTIQSADGWQVELVDALPGGAERWWPDHAVQDAFVESVHWRLATSFNDRTLELLNHLNHHNVEILGLLLELSLVQDHPWNANLLHKNLADMPLAERDAWWTLTINDEEEEGEDRTWPASRIIDWGSREHARTAPAATVALALTALGWLFASTSGRVRDGATKAAVNLLLGHGDLFPDFLARFAGVDDLYVLERVVAAGASACLRDPTPVRLAAAADSIYSHIFAGRVPRHLLLRDYGRAVIDLAQGAGVLPAGVNATRCRPPYDAPAPKFGLCKAAVDARGKAVGASSILSSCYAGTADFGRYIIESRLRDLSDAPLSGPKPLTIEERYRRFRSECTDGDDILTIIMDIVEMRHAEAIPSYFEPAKPGAVKEAAKSRRDLLTRLPAACSARFPGEALPHLRGKTGWPAKAQRGWSAIDPLQAKLWVANAALDLGWTNDLFPHDGGRGSDRPRATPTERIGKKYQWLAYFDLLARVADNYWIAPEHYGSAKAYDTPIDLEFTRDIDPTTPPTELVTGWPDRTLAVPKPTQVELREVEAAAMPSWAAESHFVREAMRGALVVGGTDEGEWVTLYRFTSAKIRYDDERAVSDAPFRQDEFHFLTLVAVEKAKRADFLRRVSAAKADFHEWLPADQTDGPYLYEIGLRPTWPDAMWSERHIHRGPDLPHVAFTNGYHWEGHLDGTLPHGLQLQLPCAWLLGDLALAADPLMAGIYRDVSGAPVIVSHDTTGDSYCIMRRDRLVEVLDRHGLHAVWLGIGERTGWPDPARNRGTRKRWNAVMYLTAVGPRFDDWFELTS